MRQRITASDLPPVRGRYVERAEMSAITWFRVGGPADVLFTPADEADLADFLKKTPADVPVYPVGVGSNLLVRDGGVRGVVVRLGAPFAKIEIDGTKVRAGAAALDAQVAKAAGRAGVASLEFYRGVPGTIGGALVEQLPYRLMEPGVDPGCDLRHRTGAAEAQEQQLTRPRVLEHVSQLRPHQFDEPERRVPGTCGDFACLLDESIQ